MSTSHMGGTGRHSDGTQLRTGKRFWLGALLSTLVAVIAAGTAHAVEVGEVAPEISGKDMNGKTVTLSSLRGKVVIVDFMASWCGPCKESLPTLNKLAKAHAKDLVVIAVSVDEKPENLKTFLKKVPVSFSVVHDSGRSVASSYAPPKMPSSFVIDKKGKIRYVHGGFRAGDEKVLEQHVIELLR